VHRLREFVQRGQGRREPVDLRELVRKGSRWLMREMEKERVMLRLHLGTRALPVLADHVQIEQVFVNILQNAIDAVRDMDGRVREVEVKAARAADGMAEIVVKDTGRGLAPEVLQRLFEPYFTTKTLGLGMGLAISRTIIEAHEGYLRLESRAGGTGATVRIGLPLNGRRAGRRAR